MAKYNIITESNNSTVVSEYKPLPIKSTAYQLEADLEEEFINLLNLENKKILKCFRIKNRLSPS